MIKKELTPEEIAKQKARERFSGYQLNLVQLDQSGPAYIVMGVLPQYYEHYPQDWTSQGTFPTTPMPISIQP